MKAATLIGIVIAALGLLGGAIMEGTSPVALFNIPAIIIVIGGTAGVSIASVGLEAMKRVAKLIKMLFNVEPPEPGPKVGEIVRYADRARRDGLLALEEELEGIEDEF